MVKIVPADRARQIWDKWARYEYQFGTLEAAQSLEQRMSEVYPTGELSNQGVSFSDTHHF